MCCPGPRLGCIRTIQLFQIALNHGRSEVPVEAVHCLDPGSIHGQEFPAIKVKLPTEVNEFTEHLPEGCPVGAPVVGNGPELLTQPAQQLDHIEVAVCVRLQSTA